MREKPFWVFLLHCSRLLIIYGVTLHSITVPIIINNRVLISTTSVERKILINQCNQSDLRFSLLHSGVPMELNELFAQFSVNIVLFYASVIPQWVLIPPWNSMALLSFWATLWDTTSPLLLFAKLIGGKNFGLNFYRTEIDDSIVISVPLIRFKSICPFLIRFYKW